MAWTWTHPELGTFVYDDDEECWCTEFREAAFDRFGPPESPYRLLIHTISEPWSFAVT